MQDRRRVIMYEGSKCCIVTAGGIVKFERHKNRGAGDFQSFGIEQILCSRRRSITGNLSDEIRDYG
ncbi:MAG: hypothetical protein ACLS8T_30400 [Anaerobutyricum sp.]